MAEEIIEITCYNKKEVWKDRNKAMNFYLEAMAGSSGSEQERYVNIYRDLIEGKTKCFDTEQYD